MRTEPDCIFCGIVAGEIPSTTIAQSKRAIAFMDINPVTPGHALMVPRSHATDLFDISTEDLAACAHLAQQISERAKTRLRAGWHQPSELQWRGCLANRVPLPPSRHPAVQGPTRQGRHRIAMGHSAKQPRRDQADRQAPVVT